jgi:thioredoxin-related protein
MENSTARFFLWAVLSLFACLFVAPVLLAADPASPGKQGISLNTYQEGLEMFFGYKEKKPAKINWHSYEEGLSLAKNEKKKIYLLFYTNRCHYCKVMETDTFANAQVIAMLNDNFIPIKVDLGARPALGSTYPSPGVPMSWFLESNGDKIGSRAGYFPPDQFMEMLQFIISEKYKQ